MKKFIAIIALAFASFTLHAETPAAPATPPGQPAASAPTPAVPAPAAPAAQTPAAPVQRREEEEGQQAPGIAARVKAFLNRDGSASLIAQINQLTTERDTMKQQLATVSAELAKYKSDFAEIEQALSEQRNVVKATATTIAQTIGIPLESLPAPRTQDQTENTITRADFEKLSHAERNAFFQKGGTFRAA